ASAAENALRLEIAVQQVLFEQLRAGQDVTALVEDDAAAVEHQLVLPADEVHRGQHDAVVGGPSRQHSLPAVTLTGMVGRGVDVDDELGASGRLLDDRSGRIPDVLADRDAKHRVVQSKQAL